MNQSVTDRHAAGEYLHSRTESLFSFPSTNLLHMPTMRQKSSSNNWNILAWVSPSHTGPRAHMLFKMMNRHGSPSVRHGSDE